MKLLFLMFMLAVGSFCLGQAKYDYFSRSAIEQDLSFFSEKLTSIHPIFMDEAYRLKWENEFSKISKSIKDSMTQNELFLIVAPYISCLNDGHTNFICPTSQRGENMKKGGLSFPFSVEIKDSSILITEYYGDDSTIFEGGEVIEQINEISAVEILKAMRKLTGAEKISIQNGITSMNFRYFIWMLFDFEKDYNMVVRNKQNRSIQVFVPGVNLETFYKNKKRYPSKNAELYSLTTDSKTKSAILTIRSFAQLNSFCSFADSAFKSIADRRIENLIIDVRGNGGGRSIVVDSLMNYLTDKEYSQYQKIETRVSQELITYYNDKYPEKLKPISIFKIGEQTSTSGEVMIPQKKGCKFKGAMYLLIDSRTYSGAATFAGVFKELDLGTIVGEESGGTIAYYGDFWYQTLPNSGLQFHVSPKRFTQYGGTDLAKGVVPNYFVTNSSDSIINFTLNMIEKQRHANVKTK